MVAGHEFPDSRSDSAPRRWRYGDGAVSQTSVREEAFLSMWSYPGVFRDQGKTNGLDGKEVCDLLVVFQREIIIFSDKSCTFPDSGDLEVDWSRCFAERFSLQQLRAWGAERWISRYPSRLFLDRGCTQRFPLKLPGLGNRNFSSRARGAHMPLIDAERRMAAAGVSISIRISEQYLTIPGSARSRSSSDRSMEHELLSTFWTKWRSISYSENSTRCLTLLRT